MMKIKNAVVSGLFCYIVFGLLQITQGFGQTPNVTTNNPQTISVSSASLTASASSGSGVASTIWTKFSVPGQALKKVIVVGSSTAAGNGATSGANAFVNKLRSYYQSQSIVSDIVNLAVAGTTPFDININSVLDQGTDILLVSYPSNGYTASNNSNALGKFQEFQNACNSRGVQMYVTGTQPRNDFNDADRANLITMNNLLRNMFGDRFIDFLTPLLNTNGNVMKAEYYADGIHPNDAGHEVLFQLVKGANIFRNSISSSSTITSPTNANTNITGLVQGVHKFQVGIVDNGGFAASAVAIITVNSVTNQPPTANAGPAPTIVLPTSQVTLNGSGNANNGGTVTFAWTQTGGTAATITNPSSAVTTVTGLTTAGSRIFRLTVTDNQGASATSDVTVTVNSVSNSKTIPGRIEAESWDNKSGSQYSVATTDVGGGLKMVNITTGSWLDYNVNVLNTGNYTVGFRIATPQVSAQFQIKSGNTVLATVNLPSTGSWDNWNTVTVSNIPLTAGNQVIRILSSGTNNCDFNWVEFVLPNQPPTANAGAAQTIALPATQATLSGSGTDPEGGALTYTWTQVSGTAATIASASSASTNITGLATTGVRTFRLTVTDNQGATATSDVTVTVNPAPPNPPPTANAGSNQTITLPASSVTLSGSGTANNGGTISFAWTIVSGPNTPTIVSAASASTNVTGLIQGTYVFRLTVTQSDNQTTTSDVTITVNPVVVSNGKTIPGRIEAEAWDAKSSYQYSVATTDAGGGFKMVGISTGSSLDYNVNVITSGSYTVSFRIATPQAGSQFQIKLGTTVLGTITMPSTGSWDTWNTYSISNVALTAGSQTLRILSTGAVNCDFNWMEFALPNQPPTANAGIAQTITLPASQVTLSGSGTANNGGTVSFAWTRVSGPNTPAIVSAASASTNVTGLIQGTYVFRLTVTQSDNQTNTSDVTITVNPVVVSNGKTIPGRIEAEAWDTKSGYQYSVATTDVGGGLKMVGISNGSWMDYNVTVTQSGNYTVGFRVATTQVHAQFQILSGSTVLATVNLPSTGSWDNWNTVTVSNVPLTAGNKTLRILSTNTESCDFNWMEYTFINSLIAAKASATVITDDALTITEKQKPLSDLLAHSSAEIFPNPVRDQFVLSIPGNYAGALNVQIVNLNGKIMKEIASNKNKGSNQLALSAIGLPQGTYFIRLQGEGWSNTIKMIKL